MPETLVLELGDLLLVEPEDCAGGNDVLTLAYTI
jgi:hypothetical protein